jgi:hypothetical protein
LGSSLTHYDLNCLNNLFNSCRSLVAVDLCITVYLGKSITMNPFRSIQ